VKQLSQIQTFKKQITKKRINVQVPEGEQGDEKHAFIVECINSGVPRAIAVKASQKQ